MKMRHGEKNLVHSIVVAGVLDDPRWEKLASNAATPEEIAELRAWAERSKSAKAAWDVFRPAEPEQVDALTSNVLRKLKAQKAVQPDKRNSRPDRPKEAQRPGDMRMMSRHVSRKSERTEAKSAQGAPSSRLSESIDVRKRGIGLPLSTYRDPSSLQSIRIAPARPDATGTTSSRITLTVDPPHTDAPVVQTLPANAQETPSTTHLIDTEMQRELRVWGLVGGICAVVMGVVLGFTSSPKGSSRSASVLASAGTEAAGTSVPEPAGNTSGDVTNVVFPLAPISPISSTEIAPGITNKSQSVPSSSSSSPFALTPGSSPSSVESNAPRPLASSKATKAPQMKVVRPKKMIVIN